MSLVRGKPTRAGDVYPTREKWYRRERVTNLGILAGILTERALLLTTTTATTIMTLLPTAAVSPTRGARSLNRPSRQ